MSIIINKNSNYFNCEFINRYRNGLYNNNIKK
jgi:hypothetical protein